jgi:multidrug resistance efflux pump
VRGVFVFTKSKIKNPKGEISMFDISNLEHLVEDKAIDAKIEKLRAERGATLAKIEKAEREIEQAENKIKRLMRSHSTQEYKARTRRLIQRGAITEKFIPDAETLTNDEVQERLAQAFRSEAD